MFHAFHVSRAVLEQMNFSDYTEICFKEKGRDRDGVDCWGLVYLIYKECMGIDLPTYSGEYSSSEDAEELSRLIQGEIGPPWQPIKKGRERPYDSGKEAGTNRGCGFGTFCG